MTPSEAKDIFWYLQNCVIPLHKKYKWDVIPLPTEELHMLRYLVLWKIVKRNTARKILIRRMETNTPVIEIMCKEFNDVYLDCILFVKKICDKESIK